MKLWVGKPTQFHIHAMYDWKGSSLTQSTMLKLWKHISIVSQLLSKAFARKIFSHDLIFAKVA